MQYHKPEFTAIIAVNANCPKATDVRDWRVRRLSDKLSKDRGDTRLHLYELSRQLGVTPSHIGRRFKQQLGIGFRTFSTLKRDEYVCELLGNSNLRVKEIAALVGYRQVCDLTHRFRHIHGVTPTAYRNQILLVRSTESSERGAANVREAP
jgi:AraC-like DNA-binding protein